MTATRMSGQPPDIESRLINEMQEVRKDFREFTSVVAALTVEVKHLAQAQEETKSYGERLRVVESEQINIRKDLQNLIRRYETDQEIGKQERRFILTLTLGSLIALVGILIQLFKH